MAVFEISGLKLTHAVRYMKDSEFMQRINALMGMSGAGPVKSVRQPHKVAKTKSLYLRERPPGVCLEGCRMCFNKARVLRCCGPTERANASAAHPGGTRHVCLDRRLKSQYQMCGLAVDLSLPWQCHFLCRNALFSLRFSKLGQKDRTHESLRHGMLPFGRVLHIFST